MCLIDRKFIIFLLKKKNKTKSVPLQMQINKKNINFASANTTQGRRRDARKQRVVETKVNRNLQAA